MNLKVRVKNWSFWVSVLLAIVTPVGVYYGVSGADVTSWGALWGLTGQAASNPYVVISVLASVYNALIDPTTPGVADSARAMAYISPGKEA